MDNIYLPEPFCRKISQTFGTRGRNWLQQLPAITAACADKWQLSELTLADNLSFNVLFSGQSREFGAVVLKIGLDVDSEIVHLSHFDSRDICRCYRCDRRLGALLLERIVPGCNLLTVSSERQRTEIAADLMFRIPSDRPAEDTQTYTQWINKAFRRARRERPRDKRLLAFLQRAETAYERIRSLERPLQLLHGDLHHENILYAGSGRWKAIDPKGVIGPACLESGRFIINQLGYVPKERQHESLAWMTQAIAERLGEKANTVALCGFVELVLALCWQYEDRADKEDIEESAANAEMYLKYLDRLQCP